MTAVEIAARNGPVALPMPTAWRISPCCVGTRIGAERTVGSLSMSLGMIVTPREDRFHARWERSDLAVILELRPPFLFLNEIDRLPPVGDVGVEDIHIEQRPVTKEVAGDLGSGDVVHVVDGTPESARRCAWPSQVAPPREWFAEVDGPCRREASA
jgi:hypothetical protein